MPFLSLNGWTVPVTDGSASRSVEYAADPGERTWSNSLNRERIAIPKSWEGASPFLRSDVAETLKNLLDGEGHRFNFDGHLFSFDGLGPDSGTAAATLQNEATQTPFSGLGECQVGVSPGVTWNPQFGQNWTVMYWRLPTTAEHIVVRSDGAKWVDGVRNDSAVTTELTVSGGTVNFISTDISDLVLLQFAACDEFIEAFYTHSNAESEGFSDLPRLNARGDAFLQTTTEVLGECMDQSFSQRGAKQGETAGWKNNTRSLSFSLHEVAPPSRERIAKPDFLWVMDSDYYAAPNLEASWGRPDAVAVGTPTAAQAGPYGLGESFLLNGTTQYLTLGTDIGQLVGGAKALTYLTWVKQTSVGALRTLFSLDNDRLVLRLTATNELSLRARPDNAETVRTGGTTQQFTDTTQFHLFGVIADVENDELVAIYDGEIIKTVTAAFTASRYAAVVDDAAIGATTVPGDYFPGNVAMGALYRKRLSPAAIRKIYNQGRRGVFR